MNVLDLFSGIGGFSVGFESVGMHTAAFCECDPYAQSVLRQHWPNTPIHPDIRKFDAIKYAGTVDLVCGGYPCQPFSVAGKRQGQADERHLWPEMLRVIRSVRPRWVVAENVAGHIELGFDEVAALLEAEGFTVWPFIIPACAVGAEHRQDRLWIVANSASEGIYERRGPDGFAENVQEPRGVFCDGLSNRIRKEATAMANTTNSGIERMHQRENQTSESWWRVEPSVGRVAHGIPNRMDRLKCLGNSIVPQIAEIIGQAIMRMEAATQIS